MVFVASNQVWFISVARILLKIFTISVGMELRRCYLASVVMEVATCLDVTVMEAVEQIHRILMKKQYLCSQKGLDAQFYVINNITYKLIRVDYTVWPLSVYIKLKLIEITTYVTRTNCNLKCLMKGYLWKCEIWLRNFQINDMLVNEISVALLSFSFSNILWKKNH